MFHLHIKNNEGFIFFVLLIFIQVLSIISFFGLVTNTLAFKETDHLWKKEKLLHESKYVLRNLVQMKDLSHLPCVIPHTASQTFSMLSLDWWKVNSCSDKWGELSYYYVVEGLGHDPCGVIRKDKNAVFVANYYRITMLALHTESQITRMISQITIAKAIKNPSACNDKVHQVIEGQQSWRDI